MIHEAKNRSGGGERRRELRRQCGNTCDVMLKLQLAVPATALCMHFLHKILSDSATTCHSSSLK